MPGPIVGAPSGRPAGAVGRTRRRTSAPRERPRPRRSSGSRPSRRPGLRPTSRPTVRVDGVRSPRPRRPRSGPRTSACRRRGHVPPGPPDARWDGSVWSSGVLLNRVRTPRRSVFPSVRRTPCPRVQQVLAESRPSRGLTRGGVELVEEPSASPRVRSAPAGSAARAAVLGAGQARLGQEAQVPTHRRTADVVRGREVHHPGRSGRQPAEQVTSQRVGDPLERVHTPIGNRSLTNWQGPETVATQARRS